MDILSTVNSTKLDAIKSVTSSCDPFQSSLVTEYLGVTYSSFVLIVFWLCLSKTTHGGSTSAKQSGRWTSQLLVLWSDASSHWTTQPTVDQNLMLVPTTGYLFGSIECMRLQTVMPHSCHWFAVGRVEP